MRDDELLIRYVEGELGDADAATLRRRLEVERELRDRLERLERVRRALAAPAASGFGPFFATRVMAGVRRSEEPAPEASRGAYEALRWTFARVAAAAVLVAVALGAYSALTGGYGGSVVEAMLGLPEATLYTALALGG